MSFQPDSLEHKKFNPFRDRLCRDVRNDLSDSFISAIQSGDLDGVRIVAGDFRAETLEPNVTAYIADRVERYEMILAQLYIAGVGTKELYVIALLLWDQGLFFEFHDWLEKAWIKAEGIEKEIIQALIRAAGTYVLLGSDRQEGAEKMAAKAVGSLIRYKESVPEIFDVELLVRGLKSLDSAAPVFGADRLIAKRVDGNNML